MNKKREQINYILDGIGIVLLGVFSLGYCLFREKFAEVHLSFSFIDFPIFVGEILLFFCLALLITKWIINHQKFNVWYYLLFCFFCFVLVKAFLGYFAWGPLAFRHSALFYYPLFALCGFSFYNKKLFANRELMVLLALGLICILGFVRFYRYYLLTCILLTIILIRLYPTRWLRYALLMLLLIVIPYNVLFEHSKTTLVGNIISIIFIIINLFIIFKIKKRYKFIIAALLILFLCLAAYKLSGRYNRGFFRKYNDLICLYNEFNIRIEGARESFKSEELEIKLYNPGEHESEPGPELGNGPNSDIEYCQARVRGQNINALFRIFIWRDMLAQMNEKRHVFGFNFGWPLRSSSLEALNWAAIDWKRDGWITAHNSYLHIIYRSGIVGIIFILILISVLFKMIRNTVYLRSISGVLLCAVLINWLVMANFAVILEFPYNAIPFWSLFGMTFAYLNCLLSGRMGTNTR